jgi:hypothetical protein
MSERGHTADGEAGRRAHLVALGLAHSGAELLGVYAPIARA